MINPSSKYLLCYVHQAILHNNGTEVSIQKAIIFIYNQSVLFKIVAPSSILTNWEVSVTVSYIYLISNTIYESLTF